MDNKINFSQLSEMFAQTGGMSRNMSEQFVKSFFDIITEKVISEGLVKVKGFGTFKLVRMDDRESVNVNTGERFVIEGHSKISFIPDPDLKEAVNRPFSAFGNVILTDEQAGELMKLDPELREDTTEPQSDESENSTNAGREESASDSRQPVTNVSQRDSDYFKEIIRKKKRRNSVRKTVKWLLLFVLVAGLAMYAFWPFVAVDLMDSIFNKDSSDVPSVVAYANEGTLIQDPIETDSIPEDTLPKEMAIMPGKVDQTEPTTSFVLLDSDIRRDLTEISIADTLNYRIGGLMAVHVMENGETLTRIAQEYYGTKKLWPYIAIYNKSLDFNRIMAGTKVNIPILCNR